jgi:hypothetical protein
LKPKRWGSPLAQEEKYQGRKKTCDEIIIIIYNHVGRGGTKKSSHGQSAENDNHAKETKWTSNCQKTFITFRTIYCQQSKKDITLEVKDARINCSYQKQYLKTARSEEKF